jgi:enoyl-CoA hydratase/carnithine racemase
MQDKSSPGERVKVEIADGIAEVTLNRPDKLNALDSAMFEGLIAAGDRLGRARGLRAVVMTGAAAAFAPASTRSVSSRWRAGPPKRGSTT